MDKRKLVKGKDGLLYDDDGYLVYTGTSPLHEENVEVNNGPSSEAEKHLEADPDQ